MRSILAVLAGAAVWAILWIASTQLIASASGLEAGDPIESVPILLTFLLISVVFSMAAGVTTGLVARRQVIAHALALGILQLALGLVVQIQAWSLMPVWYHIPFLALLIPANVCGGWLSAQRLPAVRMA